MTDNIDKPGAPPLPVAPEQHGITVYAEMLVDENDPTRAAVLFHCTAHNGVTKAVQLEIPALSFEQCQAHAAEHGVEPRRCTLPQLLASARELVEALHAMQRSYDKQFGRRILLADVNAPGFRGFKRDH
ncbi:MAG: hypothetical protein IT480_14330 [Gammaproteobacteria bacterium]|nr:hypothetical protein [Gammaproteobacteria bacterium]